MEGGRTELASVADDKVVAERMHLCRETVPSFGKGEERARRMEHYDISETYRAHKKTIGQSPRLWAGIVALSWWNTRPARVHRGRFGESSLCP